MYNQYILATVTQDGVKLPVNNKGYTINALDPANWMTKEEAQEIAKSTGYLLSFVLSENDPYFCLDIDHCLMPDGASWSPLATKLCTKDFKGAMVEVSQSGKGLHIWGQYSEMPEHKCKNIELGIELYHKDRFIILGHHPTGDAESDHSVALRSVVADYFTASGKNRPSPSEWEWTSSPVPDWSGPEDDAELIELAKSRKGLGAIFKDDAITFLDLWERDEQAISKAFPDQSGQRPYDASSADMSLAQRLAYYTGKNCERMKRLMQQSGLVREKWDERPDYLTRTIINACAGQTKVYSKPSPSANANGEDKRMTGGWADSSEFPQLFSGCVYIVNDHRVLTPGQREPLKPEQFNVVYGGYTFAMDERKTTRNAFEAFTQCPTWRCPEAETTCFKPELPFGEMVSDGDKMSVNTYRPLSTPQRPGDISKFMKLLRANFHKKDREILLSYIATVVQNPGAKLQWAPLLQGPEGNGKTLILRSVIESVGRHYSHTLNAQDISGNGGKFTGWLERKLLVVVEDIHASHDADAVEILKPLITNDLVEMQSKGKDQKTTDNRANFMFTSNYFDALRLKADQRRFCPIASLPQTRKEMERAGLTPLFLADIWDWARGSGKYAGKTPGFHHIHHFFKNYDVQEQYDPLGQGNMAPRSKYYHLFQAAGSGRIEQELLEAVEQGSPGFRGGWVSSTAFDNLLHNRRLAHKMSYNKRNEIITSLGFVPHPNLDKGRATRVVMPDGARPKLYIRDGHPSMNYKRPAEICDAYTRAQTSDSVSSGEPASSGGGNVSPIKE